MTARSFSPAAPRVPSVTAELGYLKPMTNRPYNYMYEPPAGTPWDNCDVQWRPVRIADARAMNPATAIDIEGFELWDAPSAVIDFRDEDAIRNRYYRKPPSWQDVSREQTAPTFSIIRFGDARRADLR